MNATAFLQDDVMVRCVGRHADGVRRRMVAGRVIAVFERSFYIAADPGGEIFCVGTSSIANGPVNAVFDLGDCSDRIPRSGECIAVERGMLVRRTHDGLLIGGLFNLRFDQAHAWQPAPVPAPPMWRLERGHQLLESRAPLLPPGLDTPHFRESASRMIDSLDDWLHLRLADEIAQTPDEIRHLVGLGPGLTPAGDDYICGVLLALRAFGRPDLVRALTIGALQGATARTGRISHAHLRTAASGEGAVPVHDVIHAVAIGDATAFHRAMDDLDRVGHTSGFDALAGVYRVVNCIVRERVTARAA